MNEDPKLDPTQQRPFLVVDLDDLKVNHALERPGGHTVMSLIIKTKGKRAHVHFGIQWFNDTLHATMTVVNKTRNVERSARIAPWILEDK